MPWKIDKDFFFKYLKLFNHYIIIKYLNNIIYSFQMNCTYDLLSHSLCQTEQEIWQERPTKIEVTNKNFGMFEDSNFWRYFEPLDGKFF